MFTSTITLSQRLFAAARAAAADNALPLYQYLGGKQKEYVMPVPLMNKYFEYQTQLCHGYESAPDPQAWERENCFLKI